MSSNHQLSDIEYIDHLQYFYLGGVIYGALKRYDAAEDFLETVRSSQPHLRANAGLN
jgi:hypothetical protein